MTRTAGIASLMTFAERQREEKRSKVVPLPSPVSDETLALTQGVLAGDEIAAREFFEKYCDRLFRYLLVLTRGNEDLSRDLLSTAMIKSMRNMKPMRSDQDLWRWLTRLAWTSFIDQCRKQSRRIITLPDEGIAENRAASAADTKMSDALNECLAELPDEEREFVAQYYFDDRSQSDLAADTNSTRKAVESRLARIRQKLRSAILKKLA